LDVHDGQVGQLRQDQLRGGRVVPLYTRLVVLDANYNTNTAMISLLVKNALVNGNHVQPQNKTQMAATIYSNKSESQVTLLEHLATVNDMSMTFNE
jgi:hypothetical protein